MEVEILWQKGSGCRGTLRVSGSFAALRMTAGICQGTMAARAKETVSRFAQE
jgi:hypothetical protein